MSWLGNILTPLTYLGRALIDTVKDYQHLLGIEEAATFHDQEPLRFTAELELRNLEQVEVEGKMSEEVDSGIGTNQGYSDTSNKGSIESRAINAFLLACHRKKALQSSEIILSGYDLQVICWKKFLC